MYKKTFILKQITPIIHFQYGEGGNCFRLTEFKPKFDKFIKKYENRDLSSHFIPEKKALNYKVKVKSVEEVHDDIDISEDKILKKLYFASGMDDNASHGVFAKGNIKLEFFSYDNKLIELIDKCIGPFLSVENFGTRQSKGFGGYYLNDGHNYESDLKDAIKKTDLLNTYLRFSVNDNSRSKTSYKLSNVVSIYEKLKSGSINVEKTYLAEYFDEKIYDENMAIGSDKDKVRYKFFKIGKIDSYDEMYFTNALLGLMDEKDYVFRNNRMNDTVCIKPLKVNHNSLIGNDRYDSDLSRFKSPVTFKLYGNYVYVIGNDFNSDILGREFEFSTKNHTNTPFIMKIPSSFNLEHLITKFGESQKQINCTVLKAGDKNA